MFSNGSGSVSSTVRSSSTVTHSPAANVAGNDAVMSPSTVSVTESRFTGRDAVVADLEGVGDRVTHLGQLIGRLGDRDVSRAHDERDLRGERAAINGSGKLVYSSSMSTLSSTNVPQSVGSFGMVTWNVPIHGVAGSKVSPSLMTAPPAVQLMSTTAPPGNGLVSVRRRDLGRKVTGVLNGEIAGDGLAECRRQHPDSPWPPTRQSLDLLPGPAQDSIRQACRPRQQAPGASAMHAPPRPQCDSHG